MFFFVHPPNLHPKNPKSTQFGTIVLAIWKLDVRFTRMTKSNYREELDQVWLNGILMHPSEYEIKDGVITFKEAPPEGRFTIGIRKEND